MDTFWLWAGAFLCTGFGVVAGITYARLTASVESTRRECRRRQKSIKITNKRLDEIRHDYAHAPQQMHSHADGCVAGLLIQLGYVEVVDKWEQLISQKEKIQ